MVEPIGGSPFAEFLSRHRLVLNRLAANALQAAPPLDEASFKATLIHWAAPLFNDPQLCKKGEIDRAGKATFTALLRLNRLGYHSPDTHPTLFTHLRGTLLPLAPLFLHSPDALLGHLVNLAIHQRFGENFRRHAMFQALQGAAPDILTLDEFRVFCLIATWQSGAAGYRLSAIEAIASCPPKLLRHLFSSPECHNRNAREIKDLLTADPWWGGEDSSSPFPRVMGGFRGFGGPFLTPPDLAFHEGLFLARDRENRYLLHFDAHGAQTQKTQIPFPETSRPSYPPTLTFNRGEGSFQFAGITHHYPFISGLKSHATDGRSLALSFCHSHHIAIFRAR